MDFAQICMNLIHGHGKKLKKVLETLTLFSRSQKTKLQNLGQKYLNAHYLRSGSVDFIQICMNSISGHDNKPIKFWGP